MSDVTYNLTELIDEILSNNRRYNEYTLDSEGNSLEFRITSTGDSLDLWCGEGSGWCEEMMLYQNNSPLEDDENATKVATEEFADTPCRTHDYKACYREYTLELPPNRHRGDRYTVEDIRNMIVSIDNHEDIPGVGFDYHNMPECEYCYERLMNG